MPHFKVIWPHRARSQFFTIRPSQPANNIYIFPGLNFHYVVYESGDPHKPIISWWSLRTLRITWTKNWEYLEQNWNFFVQIWRFRRANVNCHIRMERSKNGEYFTTIQSSRWHTFYLGQGILRILQGEIVVFYCTFVNRAAWGRGAVLVLHGVY